MTKRDLAGLACILALLISWSGWKDHLALHGFYQTRPIFGRDLYGSYLVEAAMFRDGAYASIWDLEANRHWQQAHGWLNVFNDCPYPPLMALIWIPATYFSIYQAVMSWFYLNLGLMVLAGWALAWFAIPGLAPRPRMALSLLMTPALFFSAPATDCFLAGQMTSLVLSAVGAFAICYCLQRSWLAPLCLALAISLKVYPLVFLMVPLALLDWQTIRRVVLFGVLLTLPIFFYSGLHAFSIYAQYVFQVLPGLVSTSTETFSDQSLKGVFTRIWGPPGGAVAMVMSLAMLAASPYCIRRRGGSPQTSRAYGVAIVSLLQLTCIGRSWPNYHITLWLTLTMACRAGISPISLLLSMLLYTFQALADGEVTTTTNGIYFRNWVMSSGGALWVNLFWWALLAWQARFPTEQRNWSSGKVHPPAPALCRQDSPHPDSPC